TAEVTPDMHRIDARGKWLMPGLTDMHVHLENIRMLRLVLKNPEIPADAVNNDDVFLPYLANGVLQVLSLQGMSETIGQRVEIEAGRVLGPRIFAAAMIDGQPPLWPVGMTRVATTPEEGRQAVRDAAAEDYDAIKVYSRLSFEALDAIVDEARKLKLPVVGHLPGRQSGRVADAVEGLDMVAHAEEFALYTSEPSFQSIPQYVELMKKNGHPLARRSAARANGPPGDVANTAGTARAPSAVAPSRRRAQSVRRARKSRTNRCAREDRGFQS